VQATAPERRNASRYRLHVPVLFSWAEGETVARGGGFTRDVSVRGLFVTSSIVLPVKTALTLEMILPALSAEMPQNTIRAPGRVVRMFGPTERTGFAVAAELYADTINEEASARSSS